MEHDFNIAHEHERECNISSGFESFLQRQIDLQSIKVQLTAK